MNIVGMAYGRSHSDELHRRELEGQVKNHVGRRQVEEAALQKLQHEYAKNLSPDIAPPQSLAAQMRAAQQRIYACDVAAAVILGGLIGGMTPSGKSKRKRP